MEYWLRTRGLQIVKQEDVNITDFKIPSDMIRMEQSAALPELSFRSQHKATDANLPHAIGRLCHDTVTLYVVATANHKQLFLVVRDNLSATFPKKELVEICENLLRFAPCIIVASRISLTSVQVLRETTQKHGFAAELLSIQDVLFDKLRCAHVPEYRVLNRDEVAEIEEQKKCKSADFPRMLASDPIAKYCKFSAGNVLEKRDKRNGEISYRIVTTNSGIIPPTHTTSKHTAPQTTHETI